LRNEVLQMREKLRQHHGVATSDPKHSSGGIVDLEFISQYLVLGYAAVHAQLYRYSDNIRILDAAAECGLLAPQQVQELQQAYQLLRGAGHRQTLAPATLPEQDSLTQAKQTVEQCWRQLFNPL
jgi:glutamate-ammonia-ligase adenylyltransferase